MKKLFILCTASLLFVGASVAHAQNQQHRQQQQQHYVPQQQQHFVPQQQHFQQHFAPQQQFHQRFAAPQHFAHFGGRGFIIGPAWSGGYVDGVFVPAGTPYCYVIETGAFLHWGACTGDDGVPQME